MDLGLTRSVSMWHGAPKPSRFRKESTNSVLSSTKDLRSATLKSSITFMRRVGNGERFANGVDPLAKSFPCSQFTVASTFKDDASKWHESLTQNWFHTKFGELSLTAWVDPPFLKRPSIELWRRSKFPERDLTHQTPPEYQQHLRIGSRPPQRFPAQNCNEALCLRKYI